MFAGTSAVRCSFQVDQAEDEDDCNTEFDRARDNQISSSEKFNLETVVED